MKAYQKLLNDYIKINGIRQSRQRNIILEIFVKTERHLTSAELYELVKKIYPSVGYATVYRAIKVFCESGLAEEIDIGDGVKRYEHKYGHEHHDHLICIKCKKFIEFKNSDIEKLQDKIAGEFNFQILGHKLQIMGLCEKCRK